MHHLTIVAVTRNKSIHTTTLHSIMGVNMVCMNNGVNLDVNFVPDRSNIQKYIKACDKFLFFDYGVSVPYEVIQRLVFEDFPEGYKGLVVPCVTGDVDWSQFKKKTLENSNDEPVHQRALKFDTVYTPAPKKHADKIHDFVSGDCRLFCIDAKAALKKFRESKTFDLNSLGLKIGVLRSAPATCHYVYECIGNILESSGVKTSE